MASTSPYSFQIYQPGTLTYRDIGTCGWGEWDNLETYSPIPETRPIVVILGQQKSGTTWFQNALIKHPSVIQPVAPRGACASSQFSFALAL